MWTIFDIMAFCLLYVMGDRLGLIIDQHFLPHELGWLRMVVGILFVWLFIRPVRLGIRILILFCRKKAAERELNKKS